MDNITSFAVGGVPIILVVFALVEEIKAWGLQGRILRFVSLALGILFALAYQISFFEIPGSNAEWFTLVFIGLIYGLSASGAYNFLDDRL